MLARAHTFTIEGLQARPVAVEVDIRRGLPAFTIVGLADAAVREARDRVRSAIQNSGYEFPQRRITANLAPGDVPKVGPGLDLALACAVLAASEQLPVDLLTTHALFGELGLDGELRPCHGTLAVAQAAHEEGLPALLLAPARAREAALVDGLEVIVAGSLGSAVRVLAGGAGDPLPAAAPSRAERPPESGDEHSDEPDLADVRGQRPALDALLLSAAGGHNLLLSGPPGTGKTMLAQRLPGILPPLSRPEAIEVTRIHSITGRLRGEGLVSRRPFRAPHHTITPAGLVGGARPGWIGEIVLAHRGVLFLDELSEFSRAALEALRQPLEDGRVAIVRARHSAVYPARFALVAATNPCPCGHLGDEHLPCRCRETDLARHRRRLSGPLLDRIDLIAHLQRPGRRELGAPPAYTSARARELVIGARRRQAARLRGTGVCVNADLDTRLLRRHLALSPDGERLLEAVEDRRLLSTRGLHRLLRVARTAADVEGSARTRERHLSRALSLRVETAQADRRAA